jgi:EAL domain-containing protein (putative c-di-GMP-specific phosphodiesterase class I)
MFINFGLLEATVSAGFITSVIWNIKYAVIMQKLKTGNNNRILVRDLHKALESGEFILHYQPQASLEDGKVVGVEALVRWNHPTKGIIQPDEFIPVAESSGFIVQLGYWVLQEACRQHREWGVPSLRMSVNLSGHQFYQEDLVSRLTEIINAEGMKPENLTLEITETVAMSDVERTLEVLKQLRAIGFPLSIDDFGTGYSSLVYLTKFPITELKIDRSFVTAMSNDAKGKIVIRCIIDLAKQLGLSVVAEGVETEEQAKYLKELSCDDMQGYLLSPPVASDKFFLRKDKGTTRLAYV